MSRRIKNRVLDSSEDKIRRRRFHRRIKKMLIEGGFRNPDCKPIVNFAMTYRDENGKKFDDPDDNGIILSDECLFHIYKLYAEYQVEEAMKQLAAEESDAEESNAEESSDKDIEPGFSSRYQLDEI